MRAAVPVTVIVVERGKWMRACAQGNCVAWAGRFVVFRLVFGCLDEKAGVTLRRVGIGIGCDLFSVVSHTAPRHNGQKAGEE